MRILAFSFLFALSMNGFAAETPVERAGADQNCPNYSGSWNASCDVSAGDGAMGGSYLMAIKIAQVGCQSIQLPSVGYYPLRTFADDVFNLPVIGETYSSVLNPQSAPELQDHLTKSSQWGPDGSLAATISVDRAFSPKYWQNVEYRQKITLRNSADGNYVVYASNWTTTRMARGQRQYAGARSVSCVLEKQNAK